jgi:hypothetical protein
MVGAQVKLLRNGTNYVFKQLPVWVRELHNNEYLPGARFYGKAVEFNGGAAEGEKSDLPAGGRSAKYVLQDWHVIHREAQTLAAKINALGIPLIWH